METLAIIISVLATLLGLSITFVIWIATRNKKLKDEQAGFSNTTSNFLYIENSNSETPLIGGNFATDRVGINLANASLAHTLDVGGIINSTGGLYVDATARIDGDGFFKPAISSDAAAPANSIYYSTTQSKLVYKDAGNGINVLY